MAFSFKPLLQLLGFQKLLDSIIDYLWSKFFQPFLVLYRKVELLYLDILVIFTMVNAKPCDPAKLEQMPRQYFLWVVYLVSQISIWCHHFLPRFYHGLPLWLKKILQRPPKQLTTPHTSNFLPPPPPQLQYTTICGSEPFLPPSCTLFHHFDQFQQFCSHPDYFTSLRTYCLMKKTENELQFILEMVHLCDYICQAFINADQFFDTRQFPMLISFRQLPRSVLVVNGRFICSATLPEHELNENPEQWVLKAVTNLWVEYCLPNARHQLRISKSGWCTQEVGFENVPLRLRIVKLVDIFAHTYSRFERIFLGETVKSIRAVVEEKAGTTHCIRSASMMQKWSDIRNYELAVLSQQQPRH